VAIASALFVAVWVLFVLAFVHLYGRQLLVVVPMLVTAVVLYT
jgi:hypothetical protein